MRLDKFICKSTDLNREQARQKIQTGQAWVNGDVITEPSMQVHENNRILLNDLVLVPRASTYIMMYKPQDYICSNVDESYPSLFNLLNLEKSQDFHIAGRLDADTTGLVFITDDGRWSQNIISPVKQCYKTYRVSLRNPIENNAITQFSQGIQLQGETHLTRPAKLQIITGQEVLLSISEGKYHQVKRMFAALANKVVTLHRQQIGDISLDPILQPGQWRYLTKDEVAAFL